MRNILSSKLVLSVALAAALLGGASGSALAACCGGTADTGCTQDIPQHYNDLKSNVNNWTTQEEKRVWNQEGSCSGSGADPSKSGTSVSQYTCQQFVNQKEWTVDKFWKESQLPAFMEMTKQLTNMAMQQSMAQGMFADAQAQVDTQRLLQQMQANTVNSLTPSPLLCTFGTNMRSLAYGQSKANLNYIVLNQRAIDRQLANKDTSGRTGNTDKESRLKQFKSTYCDPGDNNKGLKALCESNANRARWNKDIDFPRMLDGPYTLDVDFADANVTKDEEDVMALASNLYGHEVFSHLPSADVDGKQQNQDELMDMRAVVAKRLVAQNSFNVITSMKAKGTAGDPKFMYAVVKGLGISDDDTIKKLMGEKPSYYAQMEVLTKKIYQDPRFFTALIDKPENVARERVAMQSFKLMQQRDIYESILRSEMLLSLLVEMEVRDAQEPVQNMIGSVKSGGQR